MARKRASCVFCVCPVCKLREAQYILVRPFTPPFPPVHDFPNKLQVPCLFSGISLPAIFSPRVGGDARK